MVGREYRLTDYFISLSWVVVVIVLHATNYAVRARFVQCSAGTFDKDCFIGFRWVDEYLRNIDLIGVTLNTQPDPLPFQKGTVAVDTFFLFVHLCRSVVVRLLFLFSFVFHIGIEQPTCLNSTGRRNRLSFSRFARIVECLEGH